MAFEVGDLSRRRSSQENRRLRRSLGSLESTHLRLQMTAVREEHAAALAELEAATKSLGSLRAAQEAEGAALPGDDTFVTEVDKEIAELEAEVKQLSDRLRFLELQVRRRRGPHDVPAEQLIVAHPLAAGAHSRGSGAAARGAPNPRLGQARFGGRQRGLDGRGGRRR